MRMVNCIKPDIIFRPNGQIDITARVTRLLHLQSGDAINVWHAGGEYYLYVPGRDVRGKMRGVVYSPSHCSYLRTNFAELARGIIRVCGSHEARLRIGEPTNVHPIGIAVPLITRNNLYNAE